MSYFEIFMLALALSVDACAVSFSYGLTLNKKRKLNALLLASFTGFFQGLMPLLGYYLTTLVKSFIQPYANIIIFVIFVWLGARFIKESFQEEKSKAVSLSITNLLFIGIATSIDAFSAGISLSLYGNKIFKPACLIALITFLNSCLGFKFGGKLKHLPSKWLEITAGLILIILGLKALV